MLGGMDAEIVPFHLRLQELLERQGADATQSWLAERTGVDRSLISRVMRGERLPTPETIQSLAPALGVDAKDLVAGTNAEVRLQEGGDSVRRSDYEGAISKIIEYEGTIRDLEMRVGTLSDTLVKEEKARKSADSTAAESRAEAERATSNLRELQARHEAQRLELGRFQQALARAVSEFSALKKQVTDLQKELAATKQSSKTAALLAGVGAVTSIATLAHFLGNDTSSAAKPPQESARRSNRSKS
jgi:transcriptional regulator with XRE-family HTH domain